MLGRLSVLFALCCAASFGSTDAARILMIPFFNGSHFLEIDGVGRPLVQRGHEVFVLLDGVQTLKTDRYKIVRHTLSKYSFRESYPDENEQVDFLDKTKEGAATAHGMTVLLERVRKVCTNLLSDGELFPKLQSLKLDLVLVDNFVSKCFFLVPHKLGVPFVAVGSLLPAWYARLPVLPSVVEPIVGLENFGMHFCEETPNQLSIVRRTCRMFAQLVGELFLQKPDEDYMHEYVDFSTVGEIREKAAMILVNQMPLLSSPLPKMPNVEYVGGLTTSPAKPLQKDLKEWMDEAANVVIVSFGSRFPSLPLEIAEKLFSAFGRLSKYRFLFRFKKTESNKDVVIPSNVRVMDWLPQSDALGHNSSLVFVTHSGNNGQQEALFHGVPMLCFYIHADQKGNAKRVVRRGYGKMLSLSNFSVDDLVSSLTDMVDDESFRRNIKKASAIFHSEKHPSERAADAVEHVLKYGSQHLRSHEAYQLRWWEFYMLDVLAAIYLTVVIGVVLTYKLLKCLCCRRKRDQAKTKTD